MPTRTFEQTVYHKWTNSFGCPTETVYQDGTTLVPESRFESDKIIVLLHMEKHTFAQLDPFHYQLFDKLLKGLPEGTSLSSEHIVAAWGKDAIQSLDTGLNYYLFPADLPSHNPPKTFSVRKITEADANLMSALHDACTPVEVEEGYVEVTHQIAFGCFFGEKLVAASSGYERTGFLDVGVLTHPNFRKKGLGKAVVGALCEWANEKHIIPQYRHNILNIGSQKVAESLNFKMFFRSEAITLR